MDADISLHRLFLVILTCIAASLVSSNDSRGSPTSKHYFTCFNGLQIEASLLCNGIDDCNDGYMTDECECDNKQGRALRPLCNKTKIIEKNDAVKSKHNKRERKLQCGNDPLQTEKNKTVNAQNSCFRCINGEDVILTSEVCNGILDCNDFSDECLCDEMKTHGICDLMYDPSVNVALECSNNIGDVSCGDGTCVAKSRVCNGINDCQNEVDEKYCSYKEKQTDTQLGQKIWCDVTNRTTGIVELKEATTCDELLECDSREDECSEPCQKKGQKLPKFCSKDLDCLLGSQICDGVWDSDKITKCGNTRVLAEESDCPKRFYCKGTISVDISKVCDGFQDCEDQSDESHERKCYDDRFYCENRTPLSSHIHREPKLFVWKSQLFDGIADCKDGSDECPSENENTKSFNSNTEMISMVFLRIMLWISAIIACAGNFASVFATMRSLIKKKDLPTVSVCNHYLIINLSLADFLMGIYLLAISVQGARFSGQYCLEDKPWRSSAMCTALGALVVLSSEMSVIVMLIMAVFRLYSIRRPFLTFNNPFIVKVLRISLLLGWIVSIIFAIIPAIGPLRHYFVIEAYVRNPIFSSDHINYEVASHTAQKIITSSHRGYLPNATNVVDVSKTQNIERIFEDAFPQRHILGWFDIYNQNSGCLPRLFVNTEDKAWKYSLSLVIFNFLAFCLLVFFYGSIIRINYLNEQKMKSIRSRNTQKIPKCKLEKCITRLLVTDFLCWIPISIIAFVYLSGVHVSSTTYAVTGFILLPINSAINPLLYSASLRAIISSKFDYDITQDFKNQSTSATSV